MAKPYSRGLRPSSPESQGDFLDGELLRLEQAFDRLDEVVDNTQAAIADDASGAANQATVNAILAALRAYGIIEP